MEDSSLSKEQRALKESIEGGAALAGVACGLIAALVVWLLTRNGYPILTYVFVSLTILATYWVASTVYTAIKTEDAKCKACGAAFSVAHVGREESLVAATPKKQEHAHGYVDGGKDDGKQLIVVETWTRNLPRQADISKVERLADWLRYSMGVMPLSASCSRCSL